MFFCSQKMFLVVHFVNDLSTFLLQIDSNCFAAGLGSLWNIPDPLFVVGSDASLS